MNKAQTAKFNKLFETTLEWGDGDNCIGLFSKLLDDDVDQESHKLNRLTTCVIDDNMEILEYDGCYYQLLTVIPVDSKTKGIMKKIVNCLLEGGSFDYIEELI